ncbi:MAG: hypothetical protein ACE5GC_05485 [Acidimicrobiia bacterium]
MSGRRPIGPTLAGLSLVLSACGTGTDPTAEPLAPVTTHEAPTTNAPGRPSPGDGPENPMRMGTAMLVGGWDITVVGGRIDEQRTWDVKLTASFAGNGTTTFATDVTLRGLGDDGRLLLPVRQGCADGLPFDRAVRPDATIEGHVCFPIDPDAASSIQLVAEATRSAVPDRVFLATPSPADLAADGFGTDDLVAALAAEDVEARILRSPYGRTWYMAGASEQRILCLDEQEAMLWEYTTPETAAADAATILPEGRPESGFIDLYHGTLMWWARGTVVVNYNFADRAVWDVLTKVLGPTLSPDGNEFRAPPDPLPPSDSCG